MSVLALLAIIENYFGLPVIEGESVDWAAANFPKRTSGQA
jgi:hypothetical protein